LAAALCFIKDPEKALRECRRVMKPAGTLLLGDIPADSPWGRLYTRKGSEERSIYSHAKFHTASEIMALAERAGFELQDAASTLFWEPGAMPGNEPLAKTGMCRKGDSSVWSAGREVCDMHRVPWKIKIFPSAPKLNTPHFRNLCRHPGILTCSIAPSLLNIIDIQNRFSYPQLMQKQVLISPYPLSVNPRTQSQTENSHEKVPCLSSSMLPGGIHGQ
jgi:hypothetical protein